MWCTRSFETKQEAALTQSNPVGVLFSLGATFPSKGVAQHRTLLAKTEPGSYYSRICCTPTNCASSHDLNFS